jgi:phosphoribosylaminoimidazole-succinocarboxamide synthase
VKKLNELYEGKAKKVFQTDNQNYYIVSYKDDATAFNGEKKGSIDDKGIVNNIMSNILFKEIEKKGIPTHFVKELNKRDTLVKALKIIPLEVIIRNIAAGSFSKRYGVKEGTPLLKATLEFSYKDDNLGDPLINDDHILALGFATEEEIKKIKDYSFRVNEILKKYFFSKGMKLIDFKLEFGKTFNGEKIVLADEISPDTIRIWDIKTGKKMDKDRFRQDLGNVEETYQEVLKRVSE